jgi:hypothetical protein
MNRANRQPPESAESIVGELFEFIPDDDQVKHPPTSVVELTPSGTQVAPLEFLPTDDKSSDEPRNPSKPPT